MIAGKRFSASPVLDTYGRVHKSQLLGVELPLRFGGARIDI